MLSEKQHRLATWWAEGSGDERREGVIAEGAIRSGKTWAMIEGFLLWSQARFSDRDFILAGRSIGALKRNVVTPMGGILRDFGWGFRFNRSDNVIEVGSNRYHLFGANTEASQDVLQGLTAAGCYADEVALFPRSFTDQMVGRCSVDGSKLWFNCNPENPLHYFKTEWVDKAEEKGLLHLRFAMEDNPALSPEVRARYDRMFSGVFHDRYIKGLWVVAEGLVYQLDGVPWRCSPAEALGDGSGTWFVSCDYGITNPFAAILWRVTKGRAYAVKTYYHDSKREGYRRTDSEHYEAIERLCRYRDEDGDERMRPVEAVVIDPSATSMKEEVWRRGRFEVLSADNDVRDGIADTDRLLHSGAIRVSEECRDLISEAGLYRWDEKAAGDAVIKENDHAMDAMRYMARTMLRHMLA